MSCCSNARQTVKRITVIIREERLRLPDMQGMMHVIFPCGMISSSKSVTIILRGPYQDFGQKTGSRAEPLRHIIANDVMLVDFRTPCPCPLDSDGMWIILRLTVEVERRINGGLAGLFGTSFDLDFSS